MHYGIILHKYKLVYLQTGKTASTTTLNVLAKMNGIDYTYNHSPHLLKKNGYFDTCRKWKDIPKGYTTFTNIRNPYKRVASYYVDKVSNEQSSKSGWDIYGIDESNKDMSFNEFCRRLSNINPSTYDAHLKPLSIELPINKIDILVRVENFNKEFTDKILKPYNCQHIDIPYYNKSKTYNYEDMYDNESIKLIKSIYKHDLEVFDYEFE